MTFVNLMTSYNLLASHARRLGISNDDTCKKRGKVDIGETLDHLLSFCPILSRTRFKYLDASQFNGLDEVSKLDIKSCLKFPKSVDVLYEEYFHAN